MFGPRLLIIYCDRSSFFSLRDKNAAWVGPSLSNLISPRFNFFFIPI